MDEPKDRLFGGCFGASITTRGGQGAELWTARAAVDAAGGASPPPPNLPGMTTHLDHTDREQQALQIYADDPLEDGDAVLLIDQTFCLELEGLADVWDDAGRRSLVAVLAQAAERVVVAIARDGGRLLPSDHQLWRDLHADLRDTDIELLPVRALPAA